MRSSQFSLPSGLFIFLILTSAACASDSPDVSQVARADFYYRQRQFSQALEELGQMDESQQQDPLFRQRVNRALAALYQEQYPVVMEGHPATKQNELLHRVRAIRSRHDAESGSDQSFDSDGWQVNDHVEADAGSQTGGVRGKFVVDVDGFRDGVNDVRYRTVLADFYKNSSQLAFGDTSTFTSPYFLRGSRFRGIHFLSADTANELQLLAGAYPYWLSDRDAYIYPRTVIGARDRINLFDQRLLFGLNFSRTLDQDKIRAIDVANHPRDNTVYSLDQEFRIVPGLWTVKSAQAYSVTEDNLQDSQDRFGREGVLKGTAFRVESLVTHPEFQLINRIERTGPEFRILTDLPSGSIVNNKGISADREYIDNILTLRPIGFLDFNCEASFIRNNLNHDDTISHFRQGWYTMNLGFLTPPGWPRPRIRETFMDTSSEPGTTSAAPHTQTSDTNVEVAYRFHTLDISPFGNYRVENPVKQSNLYEPEEQWTMGIRATQPLGDRLIFSNRYQYQILHQDVPLDLGTGSFRFPIRDKIHENNSTLSVRLWSTASLGLGYTYQNGKTVEPTATRSVFHSSGNFATATFTWPYVHLSADKKRKLSIFPGLSYYFSGIAHHQEARSQGGGRLSLAYEVQDDWRVELTGESRYDKDDQNSSIQSDATRVWLVWTSKWR